MYPFQRAFNDYVAKNNLSGSERTALRQKLGFMEEVEVGESTDYKDRDKILNKAKPLHKHLYKNLHKGDTEGDVNESRYVSWRRTP